MLWKKLETLEEDNLWRGAVFRFPAKYPFESHVDFMLFTDSSSESGFSLICTTGYKAGSKEAWLPKEALSPQENIIAISRDWLVKNWEEWVYKETPASEVLVISNYPERIGE